MWSFNPSLATFGPVVTVTSNPYNCITCCPYGGWAYLSDGTKVWIKRDENTLNGMTPEERTRVLAQFENDQKHLADLYPHSVEREPWWEDGTKAVKHVED